MNISSISFGSTSSATTQEEPPYRAPHITRTSYSGERTPSIKPGDSFEYAPKRRDDYQSTPQRRTQTVSRPQTESRPRQAETAVKPKAKKRHIRPSIKGFFIGLAAPLTLLGGIKINEAANAPKDKITVPFDSASTSVSRISDTYGVGEEVLKVYNGISEQTDLSKIEKLDIPSSYDYIQSRIDENEQELHKKGLKPEERMLIEEETLALRVKHEEQQAVAESYTDGKYVYYMIHTPEDNPSLAETYGKEGIPSEDFKTLFDIKDGELKRFNDLSYIIKQDDDGKSKRSYKDYTMSKVGYGSVIKIYKSAVQDDDISLKNFYRE